MKNFIYIVLFSALIAGCNSNSAPVAEESRTAGSYKSDEMEWDTTGDVNVDTIGLARNRAIRAARLQESNSIYNNSASNRVYLNRSSGKEINVDTLGLAENRRMRANNDRQSIEGPASQQDRTMESTKTNRNQNSTTSKKETAAQQKVSKENKSSDNAKSSNNSNSADEAKVGEQPAGQTNEKKDVSKKRSSKTKGAIIGAVSGAAAGAVINKRNRKVGGVVGGIIGAAAGYGIGRNKDKKDTTRKQSTDNKQQY